MTKRLDGEDGIAIIGMACMFPQAPDLSTFWHNILQKVDAISDPVPQWEAERYLSSGRIKTASGGYLKDLYRFDPREFGIMPNSLDGGEPDQFLALRVARDALADAGYLPEQYDHRDTGIVLGHSTYLHRGQGTLVQNHIVLDQTLDVLRVMCPELGDDGLARVREVLARTLPAASADIAPGLVPNVMTGRIANRLNLKGPNYLVDAACSSSLLAVAAAIDELRAGRSRMMLAGGVNASLPAEVSVIFTQLGALSGRGKVRSFETGSDGTLLGEGLGVVALKRVADALADGDRIYAVLRGVGQASDGRGQGLLAPSVEGESLAIRRAYDATGIDPASISMIEAHGTGIPLGDKTEIAALRSVFGDRTTAQGSIALGSVKSMISHCIPAAGIAGLIKSALSLHHKVLPPTLCDEVNPDLGVDKTPLYVNTEARPWIAERGLPRRAGINSFGFGGINTHAIVEEAPQAALKPGDSTPWPAELCIFSAESLPALIDSLDSFAKRLEQHPEWTLAGVAAALASADPRSSHRLALAVKDTAALAAGIQQALKRLRGKPSDRWSTRGGITYCSKPLEGGLAFLFPGEGSQYLGMFSDLALIFDEVRECLDFWCGLYGEPAGARRTDVLFPPASELTPERLKELELRLHDMDVGSEAVFIGAQAMHALLRALGVTPDAMLGHSSGESSALAVSGAIAADSAELGAFIRELNAVYRRISDAGKIPSGALLTIGALTLAEVQQHMAEVDREIVIAMDNCSNQLVVYGPPSSIAVLEQRLTAAGGICMLLPFDRGYHTPSFADVGAAFRAYYDSIGLKKPSVPLYSCASADRFPDDVTEIRSLAAAQWSNTVRFRETIQRMHADGVSTFVEVGPSGNLSAFLNDILAGREYLALPTNLRRRGGVEQLLLVIGQLYVEARPVRLERLFERRVISPVDLAGSAAPKASGIALDNTMPKIRLGERELASLRALQAERSPVQRAPEGPPDQEPRQDGPSHASADSSAVVAEHEADANQHVMSEYFGLMRTFLDAQSSMFASLQTLDGPAGATGQTIEGSPVLTRDGFLDSIVEHSDEHVVAQCQLSVARDKFLRDHVLSGAVSEYDRDLTGLSCVPLMVSLEIMAQACALLAGSRAVQSVENVTAFDWIALDEGELTLEVRARAVDRASGRYSASVVGPSGTALSAEFCFAAAEPRCLALPPLAELHPSVWNDEELYTCGMFHGPTFQSIVHIDGWDAAGIDAQLSSLALRGFFVEGEESAFVLNPVLLDAMGQLAAYWIAQHVGTGFNCFPSTIERIELYTPCPENLPALRLRARQEPLDPAASEASAPRRWDFECVDGEGRPLVRVTNLVNIFFPVPQRFYQVRRDPLNGWLGQPLPLLDHDGLTLWELALLPDDFCSQSRSIFLRILAGVFLSFEEHEEWRGLSGNVRRRREWLLGRACIKEAVRYWVYQQTGTLLYSTDVVVHHDERGAPYVDGWWRGSLIEAPEVSLSHDDQACLVAVTDPAQRIGVDREEIGRVQKPELLFGALTPREQALLEGLDSALLEDRLLRIWCAKEAAAKCLGLGLQGAPEAFEVQFADADYRSACVEHVGSQVHIAVVRESASIIALASEQQWEIQ